jgi:hypothetical protein
MNKITKLVRSLRSHLAATNHEAVNWPVVVLCWPFGQKPWDYEHVEWDQDILDALRAFNRLDRLPLPFERCVLLWDMAMSAEIRVAPNITWIAWAVDGVAPPIPQRLVDSPLGDALSSLSAGIDIHHWGDGFWMTSSSLSMAVLRRPFSDFQEQQDSPTSTTESKHIGSQELRAVKGLPELWLPLTLSETAETPATIGSPSDLEPFARLMSPCGYLLRSAIHEPYGPPSLRDSGWDRPFYTLINWDRMYVESGGACGTHAPPHPHDRHGFTRRLWKKAGIDRHELPRSVRERLRISEAKNVPLVQVRECRVRPAVFWFDDLASHEEYDWGPDNSFRPFDNDLPPETPDDQET